MSLDILSSTAMCVKLWCMTLAGALTSRIERTGETQAAFARRLGITPQTISQLIRGDIKVPTAEVRRKLARELNLRHVDILVMTGELSGDEIEGKESAVPFDSERAAVAALVPKLDETEARILRKTAQAMIDERIARQVGNAAEVYPAST
jgi:transcriptional regulator with XRE-family HTH domain